MSGFGAPARTAMPTPERPSSSRVCGSTAPCPTSWSVPSAVRMTTSALAPSAIDFRSACVAWNSARSPGAAASSAPLRASVLRTLMSLKGGFEGEVDVIGASVHVAEELRLAERARAVRHAQPEVSVACHTHVEARVQVAQELPVAAAVLRLVAQLHERDLLGVGEAEAHADTRAHVLVPAETVPVELEEAHHRPEVVLIGLLEMPLQADEAGNLDRPAARAVDQLAAEMQRRDVGVVDGVPRRAREPHDLQHVAVARVAVEHLGDQRFCLRLPARLLGRQVVQQADERLRL